MLQNEAQIDDLVAALEVRYLANRDDHLHFALLTDFLDADVESTEIDDSFLYLAKSKIVELNLKYKIGSEDIFFL
ncbi:MAG: hypothetical protein K8F91_03920, partial [Candidatus Obscuribacterales bacterium]|nr:hypothetical protein [Candidatus Obscuribacterales bacterium]